MLNEAEPAVLSDLVRVEVPAEPGEPCVKATEMLLPAAPAVVA